jgi:hypothetical protein
MTVMAIRASHIAKPGRSQKAFDIEVRLSAAVIVSFMAAPGLWLIFTSLINGLLKHPRTHKGARPEASHSLCPRAAYD